MGKPLDFADQAHYLGSFPRGEQMCDFYEIIVDGQTSYIYIQSEQNKSNSD
mgnify:CR=1 FL=1